MRNIVEDERYQKERKEMESYFTPKYLVPNDTETIESPYGRYSLTIEYYKRDLDDHYNKYSKGIIRDGDRELAVIKRNYLHFPYCWIQTADKQDYLICGEDYQGLSIVNLKTGEVLHYVPEAAYEGRGFCWVVIHHLNGNDIIAVEGCYWGSEYEIVFFDISEIMKLPNREICRVSGHGDVVGWVNPREFAYYDEDKNYKTVKLDD
ncbi:MAG: hypothetical protein ACM3UZ_10215 [Acidobacteriota bacterium]